MAEWLTLSAAATRLRWHPRKVESRARREGWERRRANRGRGMEYLVPGDLLAETAENPAGSDSAPGAANPADVAELTELLAETAELRAELAEERVARARAEGELTAKDGLIAELHTALDHERQEKAHLRVELAEARRPWVVRLVEAIRRR